MPTGNCCTMLHCLEKKNCPRGKTFADLKRTAILCDRGAVAGTHALLPLLASRVGPASVRSPRCPRRASTRFICPPRVKSSPLPPRCPRLPAGPFAPCLAGLPADDPAPVRPRSALCSGRAPSLRSNSLKPFFDLASIEQKLAAAAPGSLEKPSKAIARRPTYVPGPAERGWARRG